MQGTRIKSCLWTNDAPQQATHSLNLAIDVSTIAERIKFYNASLFSPTLSTLVKAIAAGFCTTFQPATSGKFENTPLHHLLHPRATSKPNVVIFDRQKMLA